MVSYLRLLSAPNISPEVRSLLECERRIAALPASVQTRAVFRARAALAAGVARRPLPSRGPSVVRWAAAAGLVCVATVAAGAAAYTIGVRARPAEPPFAGAPAAESAAPHQRAGGEPIDLVPAPALEGTPRRSRASAVRVELRLLQQAR